MVERKYMIYRVYFRDGNQKLFEAKNIYLLMMHVIYVLEYKPTDVVKVEEA